MKIHHLILFLLLLQYGCSQDTSSTTSTSTLSTNTITTTDSNDRTTMPTSTATLTSSSNATLTTTNDNTTSGTQSTFYSPSPTSFVYTHFPLFPIHTGSSSSAMSSARPSQSAPFPDDTIGKYGRLHISQASRSLYTPLVVLVLCCFLHIA